MLLKELLKIQEGFFDFLEKDLEITMNIHTGSYWHWHSYTIEPKTSAGKTKIQKIKTYCSSGLGKKYFKCSMIGNSLDLEPTDAAYSELKIDIQDDNNKAFNDFISKILKS